MVRPRPSRTPERLAARRAALQYWLSLAPIFSGLPAEDLRRLAGYCTLRPLPRGAYLFRKGDPVEGFFVVRRGTINVHQSGEGGREQVIHLLGPGESFAERAVILESGYPANARAEEESEVLLVPLEPFRRHQAERPDLAWRMVTSMSHHLRSLLATIEGLRLPGVHARLIHWLLQSCPAGSGAGSSGPVTIELGMKKADLAARLATRRETLSRAFRDLEGGGHLTLAGRRVVVKNPAALREWLRAHPSGREPRNAKTTRTRR